MDKSFEVKEKSRMILFINGQRETFRDVSDVDSKGGDWLRFHANDGHYILVNPENVLYVEIDGERIR